MQKLYGWNDVQTIKPDCGQRKSNFHQIWGW